MKEHWDHVYETKRPEEVSWTQEKPEISLELIRACKLPKSAKIIDIGGGDSLLVDFLLSEGYNDITVLDISEKALEKAKARLGKSASLVKWIAIDITEFEPAEHYDLWHDRATFHFLTSEEQVGKYQSLTEKFVNGFLIIGTFSTTGPFKCSGLEIKQYDEQSLCATFADSFEKIDCTREDHLTPFKTKQNFLFCRFKKKMNQ